MGRSRPRALGPGRARRRFDRRGRHPGRRQHLKIMQLLAAVDGDATTPLVEVLIASVSRLRRGMTVIVVTPSIDPTWVRPLATLRSRGVGCVAVTLDGDAYERLARELD